MSSSPTAIRIGGLSNLDRLELSQLMPADTFQFETEEADGAKHGIEPVTIIVVTVLGLRALTAWLLKNRRHDRIERTVEIELPDGTRRTERLSVDLSSSSAPDEQVLKAIADLLHVDVSELRPTKS
jgi:hypothetical protein